MHPDKAYSLQGPLISYQSMATRACCPGRTGQDARAARNIIQGAEEIWEAGISALFGHPPKDLHKTCPL